MHELVNADLFPVVSLSLAKIGRYFFRYFYLFATQLHYLKMLKEKKKCRKRWRGGLKETIELMLIRPPQLQFFEDGIKITATGTV